MLFLRYVHGRVNHNPRLQILPSIIATCSATSTCEGLGKSTTKQLPLVCLPSISTASFEVTTYICLLGHQVMVRNSWLVRSHAGNAHGKYAVGVMKGGIVVGHVPKEFSKIFWHFLTHGGTAICEVTGRRKKGKGLEVPCCYTFSGSSKQILRIKEI